MNKLEGLPSDIRRVLKAAGRVLELVGSSSKAGGRDIETAGKLFSCLRA